MTTRPALRQYVTLRASKDLLSAYRSAVAADALKDKTRQLLDELGALANLRHANAFTVASAPSLDWTLEVVGEPPPPPDPEELVISYHFHDIALLQEFRRAIHSNLNKRVGPNGEDAFVAAGADPGGDLTDHWCPGPGNLATFGRRADARCVLGVDALPPGNPGNGPKVNVVIIDQGLNKEAIRAVHPHSWGGGWRYQGISPGSAERTSHGMLIARNVLDIAPDVMIYDMPMIPKPAIAKIPLFASDANSAYHILLLCISFLRQYPRWSGPWILVNAWAIYDRSSETPLGDYTENKNPQSIGHQLNSVIAAAAQQKGIDVVFAAGNCGEFCPAPRCGKLDRGPGHSIWGANSSSAVITVGAVLTSDMWLGHSSQGPGQRLLGAEKPDFCAPSQFCETTDALVRNTGTSTACGLTAGVVAALRTRWKPFIVSPQALKQALIETARKTQGSAWNGRIGHGVLNAECAFKKLSIDFPSTSVAQAITETNLASGETAQVSNDAQRSPLAKMLSRLATLRRAFSKR